MLVLLVLLASGMVDSMSPRSLVFSARSQDSADLWKSLVTANLSRLLTDPAFASVNCSESLSQSVHQLEMFDATGKLPSGVAYGNVYSFGASEECMAIPPAEGAPQPAACMIVFDSFYWGVCLPLVCAQDLQAAISKSIGTPAAMTCEQTSNPFSPGAIGTIFVCCFFFVLVVLATVVDEIKALYLSFKSPLDSLQMGINTSEDDSLLQLEPKKIAPEPFLFKILGCFSLSRNLPKIFNLNTSKDAIHCLDGMRVLSMFWVIFGHVYFWTFSYPTDNVEVYLSYIKNTSFQIVANGFFSVDSFFYISGFLVAFGIFKALKKSPKFPWFHYYVHRYLRLTPVYAFVFLFYSELLAYTFTSPIWKDAAISPSCSSWWQNFLYIQNFQDTFGCMEWAWYLAIDMQLYIIAPLLILPLHFFPRIGLAINIILLSCLTLLCTAISYDANINANLFAGAFGTPPSAYGAVNFDSYVYLKPWMRAGPFIVGILTAFIVKEWKSKSRTRVDVIIGGWIVCLVLLFLLQFALAGEYGAQGLAANISRFGNALYVAASRTAWGIALAWITVACMKGFGGPSNTLLSAPFWIPLSRINYAAYLIHPLILYVYFQSEQAPFHVTGITIPFLFFGVLVFTYISAAIVVLFVEAPIAQLEKLFLG